MDCEYGKCEICGKEAPLMRTYYHYNGLKCDCHSPEHFDLVRHCIGCTSKQQRTTRVVLTKEQAEHVGELLTAEREGRVMVLPCKVGDTVYMVLPANARCTKYNAKCYKAIGIKWIDSHQEWRIVVQNENGWEIEVKFSDFGKTAFLNEAAALAASAGKEE